MCWCELNYIMLIITTPVWTSHTHPCHYMDIYLTHNVIMINGKCHLWMFFYLQFIYIAIWYSNQCVNWHSSSNTLPQHNERKILMKKLKNNEAARKNTIAEWISILRNKTQTENIHSKSRKILNLNIIYESFGYTYKGNLDTTEDANRHLNAKIFFVKLEKKSGNPLYSVRTYNIHWVLICMPIFPCICSWWENGILIGLRGLFILIISSYLVKHLFLRTIGQTSSLTMSENSWCKYWSSIRRFPRNTQET